MGKISLEDFKKVMDYNIKDEKTCIELHFCVDGDTHYASCWMGKKISNKKEVYWFGLTEDGREAYDFSSKEFLMDAKVFYGKSLRNIWEQITINSIDACEPIDRLSYYTVAQRTVVCAAKEKQRS